MTSTVLSRLGIKLRYELARKATIFFESYGTIGMISMQKTLLEYIVIFFPNIDRNRPKVAMFGLNLLMFRIHGQGVITYVLFTT